MCGSLIHPARGVVELKQAAILIERYRLRNEEVAKIQAALDPLLEHEISEARKALRAGGIDAWVSAFYPQHRAKIARDLAPLLAVYSEATVALLLEELGTDEWPAALPMFTEEYGAGLAARWTNDSVSQIRQIQRDEESPPDAIEERLGSWEEARAVRTGEREATQGAGAFAMFAMLAAGVSKRVWQTIGESCPLCERMNGRTEEVTRPFLNIGDTIEAGAGDAAVSLTTSTRLAHPPLHGRGKYSGPCDCLISPVLA